MIITDSQEGGILIDSIYKVYTVKNVKTCINNRDKWEIETYDNNNNVNYFFIFEQNTEAFAHWVYESAIYLELFIKLKQTYSNIKLIVCGKKAFKKLFFELFNISADDIVYFDIDNSNPNCITIPTNLSSNTCIIPSPISNLLIPACHELFQQQINRFIDFFSRISIENTQLLEWLIMPRQKKENFKPNDRIIDFSNILDFYETNKLNHSILHTDDISDLKYQIKTLRSSKNIILCDGSAFWVNLLFCSNKTFYVITRQSELQQIYYPMAKLLIQTVCSCNNNKYVYFNDQDDFLRSAVLAKN